MKFLLILVKHSQLDFTELSNRGKILNKIKKICSESSFTKKEIYLSNTKAFANSGALRQFIPRNLLKIELFFGQESQQQKKNSVKCSVKNGKLYFQKYAFFGI